jgi:hypothetical protein
VDIVIARRFRGPSDSGNGGYTCGLVAGALGAGPAEVTLRLPPPLERPLRVEAHGGGIRVLDGDALVAEARPGTVEHDVPEPPSFSAAAGAALPEGDLGSPFPECFVCGRAREPGDGLRIFAGPLDGMDGLVAATWTPADELCTPELVWSALDCPGAYASGAVGRGRTVLGRFAARVDAVPEPGERCVVTGWPLGQEGPRKYFAGTALHGQDGRLLGTARATWIVPSA